jgi:hypothetical protein
MRTYINGSWELAVGPFYEVAPGREDKSCKRTLAPVTTKQLLDRILHHHVPKELPVSRDKERNSYDRRSKKCGSLKLGKASDAKFDNDIDNKLLFRTRTEQLQEQKLPSTQSIQISDEQSLNTEQSYSLESDSTFYGSPGWSVPFWRQLARGLEEYRPRFTPRQMPVSNPLPTPQRDSFVVIKSPVCPQLTTSALHPGQPPPFRRQYKYTIADFERDVNNFNTPSLPSYVSGSTGASSLLENMYPVDSEDGDPVEENRELAGSASYETSSSVFQSDTKAGEDDNASFNSAVQDKQRPRSPVRPFAVPSESSSSSTPPDTMDKALNRVPGEFPEDVPDEI